MELKYISDIPFEYIISNLNKDIKLSSELKEKFNYYYVEIKESDSFDKDRWTKKAQDLKLSVSKEIKKSGNNKSIYVADYVEFIFGVSYLLFKKFNFSQNEVSEILGIKPTKYAKLGIYPYRCYSAYTKLDDKKNRKSLIPDNFNSRGIQIAECINKKVQAVYGCSAFIGVSNDLDLFANISSTDKKIYVLTSPMQFSDDETESLERANYAFGRYQFALGNQMFDDNDKYVPAGVLKEKIIEMIESGDIAILSSEEQNELVKEMVLSNVNMKNCMNVGYRYSEFEAEREEYRAAYEDMNIEKEKLEDDYRNHLIEYYVDDYNPGEEKEIQFLEADEVVRKHYVMRKKVFEKQEQKILKYINFPILLGTKEMLISAIIKSVKSNMVFKKSSPNGDSETKVVFCEPTFEDRLRSAASYWIAEVFADYSGNEDYLKAVMDYLGNKSPIFDYLDALNYVPSGKMIDASSINRKNIHIYMKDEKMNISFELESLGIKLIKDEKYPIMIYLDKDAVIIEEEQIKKLLSQHKSVVIVHDAAGVVADYMRELSKKLDLYIKCSEEVY